MFSLTLGGVIMELSPVSVSLSSHLGHRVTFTCSYIASQRLQIDFSSSPSPSSSMVRREVMSDSVARYSWGATRHWTVVVSPTTNLVTCSLLNNQGDTVGQLHASIYNTGASFSIGLLRLPD